jgi:hypothetical protein
MCRYSHYRQVLKASYSIPKKYLLTGVSLHHQAGVNFIIFYNKSDYKSENYRNRRFKISNSELIPV